MAPINLLDVINCSCSALKACKIRNCSCHAASLSCTDYCRCEGGEVLCCNPFTMHGEKEDEEEDEGNRDEIEGDDEED